MRLIRALWGFIGTAALVAAIPSAVRAQSVVSVVAEHSEFVATFSDGRLLHKADLVGAKLSIDEAGEPHEIRVDAVENDATSAATLSPVSLRTAAGE